MTLCLFHSDSQSNDLCGNPISQITVKIAQLHFQTVDCVLVKCVLLVRVLHFLKSINAAFCRESADIPLSLVWIEMFYSDGCWVLMCASLVEVLVPHYFTSNWMLSKVAKGHGIKHCGNILALGFRFH